MQKKLKSRFLNSMLTPTHPRQLKSACSTCTDGRAFEDAQPSHVCQVIEQEQERNYFLYWLLLLHVCSWGGACREEETLCNYSCNHPSPAGYRLARVTLAQWKKKAAGCQWKTAPREIPLSRRIESHSDDASFMHLSSAPLFVDAKWQQGDYLTDRRNESFIFGLWTVVSWLVLKKQPGVRVAAL